MTSPEDEEQEFQAALDAFMGRPDLEAAAQIADAHPILRDPYLVAELVGAARGSGDDGLAEQFFSRAKILCGPGWPDGPALVTDIITSITATAVSPLDPELHGQAINAARAIWQAADRTGPHPLLLARILGAVSWIFAQAQSQGMMDESLWQESLLQLAGLYQRTGDRGLLDEAVAFARMMVQASSASSPDRPRMLAYLQVHLAGLHAVTGDRGVLEKAVEVARELVRAIPASSPTLPLVLGNLDNQLKGLYSVTGDRGLLEEAVALVREAAQTISVSSAHRPALLNNLANRLANLYEATGNRDLLEEAVEVAREAVRATPVSNADRPGNLTNLANHLSDLYKATSDRDLLEEALAVAREAAQATPVSSAERPGHLGNLANRLAALYEATGNRDLLEEAVSVAREAQAVSASREDRPGVLTVLASRLAELYEATGDRELLEEAVSVIREAAQITSVSSIERPLVLSNLARHLGSLYEATGDRGLLEEAVAIAREVVQVTPGSSANRPAALNNLVSYLNLLYEATGDRLLWEEVVAVAREVVQVTPGSSADRPAALNNLANLLGSLYAATGDRDLLDEAGELVAGVEGSSPWGRGLLARTRARLVRADERRNDRYTAAAAELTDALNVFQDQLGRPDLGLRERRDLAQRCDGLLGDLAASRIRGGDITQGLELIEGPRLWLPEPGEPPGKLPETPVPVAWVIPSRWETVVVTCVDHRDHEGLALHIVDRTRAQIHNAVAAALNASRRASGERPEVVQDAITALCGVASEIAAAVPPAERLLIVPLGISFLLPYAAASRPDGTHLVDGTAVTIAPSLAWARAAHRQRPDGQRVGAFHPGKSPHRPLALGDDRKAFEDLLRGTVLDRPTAQKVLEYFSPGTDIGHISCHGSYNALKPWESSLQLETDLTLRAVLDHGTAPWLVNLSACETGIPDLQASEQQISFPTGFILGGAAHALATLWPIGNVHATIANRAFYNHLTEGEHPADALRHAINRLRRGARVAATASAARRPVAAAQQPGIGSIDFTHPFWWAPLTHYGSPW